MLYLDSIEDYERDKEKTREDLLSFLNEFKEGEYDTPYYKDLIKMPAYIYGILYSKQQKNNNYKKG